MSINCHVFSIIKEFSSLKLYLLRDFVAEQTGSHSLRLQLKCILYRDVFSYILHFCTRRFQMLFYNYDCDHI